MMDFNGIAGIRQFGGTTPVPTNRNENLGQADFLKLMIAQLRNQDPFEPMENGQFLSQMAQFSTVSGIQDLNRTFSLTSQALLDNQSLQAAALIDRKALVVSDRAMFDGQQAVEGRIDLPPGAMTAEVIIRDSSGATIRRLPAQMGADGQAGFSWDGRDDSGVLQAAGTYQIAASVRTGQQTESAQALVWSRIDSVSLATAQGGGVTLHIAGLGPMLLSQARAIA